MHLASFVPPVPRQTVSRQKVGCESIGLNLCSLWSSKLECFLWSLSLIVHNRVGDDMPYISSISYVLTCNELECEDPIKISSPFSKKQRRVWGRRANVCRREENVASKENKLNGWSRAMTLDWNFEVWDEIVGYHGADITIEKIEGKIQTHNRGIVKIHLAAVLFLFNINYTTFAALLCTAACCSELFIVKTDAKWPMKWQTKSVLLVII